MSSSASGAAGSCDPDSTFVLLSAPLEKTPYEPQETDGSKTAGGSTADPDSTYLLLSAPLPKVPDYPGPEDQDEEEVFFGKPSEKEKNGKFSVFTNKPNLERERLDKVQRRSWQVSPAASKPDAFSSYRDRRQAGYSIASSIDEEDERNEVSTQENTPPPTNSPSVKARDRMEELVKPLGELNLWNKSSHVSTERKKKRVNIEELEQLQSPKDEVDRFINPLNNDQRIDEEIPNAKNPVLDELDREFRLACKDAKEFQRDDDYDDEEEEDCVNSSLKDNADTTLNSSTASQWFENTHDEMLLFERFGQEYDEIVAKMNNDEKRKLKAELKGMTPKPVAELLGQSVLDETIEEEKEPVTKHPEPVLPSLEKAASTPPSVFLEPPTPKPRTQTPKKKIEQPEVREQEGSATKFSPRAVESKAALQVLKDDLALALSPNPCKRTPKAAAPADCFKTPESGNRRRLVKTPSYLRPTSASKHRASPRKDPVTKEAVDITICCRHAFAAADAAPDSSSKPRVAQHRRGPIDLRNVVSPVAQYIKRHPVPPLIRQVRPTMNRRHGDEAVAAACTQCTEEVSVTPSRGRRDFVALPEAVYKPSGVAIEKEIRDGDRGVQLPKRFGKVENVEALVVKHVGREKVSSRELKSPSTPSNFAQRQVSRDSEADCSMIDMSIREVKKVVI